MSKKEEEEMVTLEEARGVVEQGFSLPPQIFELLMRGGVIPEYSPATVAMGLVVTALGCMKSIGMTEKDAKEFVASIFKTVEDTMWEVRTPEEMDEILKDHKPERERIMRLYDEALKRKERPH